MVIKYSFFRKHWFIKGAVLVCSFGIIAASLYTYYNINKAAVVEKLAVIAELSTENIKDSLHRGNIGAVEKKLSKMSDEFQLYGVELYGSDGSILVQHNVENGQPLSSLMLGEHLSVSWPFLLVVQYSRIIFDNDRPLGLLILHSTMSANTAAALAILLLVILLVVQGKIEYVLFPLQQKKSKTADLTGQNVEPEGDEQNLSLDELVEKKTVELEQQRDQALLSLRAQGDFLANMSHEIRTAMNGVVGVLALLQKSGFTGEQNRLVYAATRSADSLLLVINDILDFSKIESGKIGFERIDFNLREVVEESIALYIDTARSKNIRLHCYQPLDIQSLVQGDPTRLRQIITNLLSNAVKFTENGEVSFRVTLVKEEKGGQLLRFTVEDTGIGIESGKLGSVFDMFTQAHEDTTRKYGGTGLGLNVCKSLVELQGGEIGVESRTGQGSTFWFTMTFATAENVEEQRLFDDIARKKVVLFDDCETCTTVISQYLRDCRVKSLAAWNGEDILHQLRVLKDEKYVPDILLVNYQTIIEQKESFVNSLITIYGEFVPELFVLSRLTGVEEELKRKGISGIIHKPIRLLQLHEELCIHTDQVEPAGFEQMEKLAGRVLLVDDEHINQQVGQMILEKIGFDVDIAVDGHEALFMTANNRYDLVLMDIQMPNLDGLQATEMIRKREQQAGDTPLLIIAMTANALPTTEKRCLRVGMNGFLSKPIKPDALLQYLRPLLEDGNEKEPAIQVADEMHTKQEMGDPGVNNSAAWNRDLALQYVGGDEGLLSDLMKLFIKRKPILLDAIEYSMQNGDGEGISGAAHAFKGAVNHFAAKQCQQLALFIENRAGQGQLEGLEEKLVELKKAAEILAEQLEQQM